MKRKSILIATVLLYFACEGFSQTQIGPLVNNARKYIWQSGSSALLPDNVLMYLGKPAANTIYRDFFQWSLPDNLIPDGAHIVQARLDFTAYPQGGSIQLQGLIYRISYDITGSTPYQTLYAEAQNDDNIIGTGSASTGTWSVTFSEGAFTQAIEAGLPSDRFTLAVRANTEILWDYWYYVPSWSATLTIWVAPVTIDQMRADGTTRLNGKPVGRWNGTSFDNITITTPPPTIDPPIGSREVLRGYQDTVSNPVEKYRVWRKNQAEQLDTVQNHRGFTRTPNLTNLTSQFGLTYSGVQIRTDLIDALGTTGGTVQFRDPWYIDYPDPSYNNNLRNRGMQAAAFYDRSSPFNPDYTTQFDGGKTYKGVFLNESGPIHNWSPPYYSVGAPIQNTINGYVSYFQNWEGSNVTYKDATLDQTGVVFTASNATAIAKYKAKLASSLSTATGTNSQRLMASSGSNVLWMVYPSAGELWCNNSNDGGANWWSEFRFTNSGGTSSAPSLAIWTDAVTARSGDPGEPAHMEPYVIYRTQSGSNYNIKYCILNTSVPYPVPTPTQISSLAIPTTVDTRPVIARLPNELWAFWEGSSALKYNYAYHNGSAWNWMGEDAWYSGMKNPSLSAPDLTTSNPNWYLTYDNGSNVYILSYPDGTFNGDAVPASVGATSFASQVTADNGTGEQVHVVWETFGDYVPPPGTDRGNTWAGTPPTQRHRVAYQKWNNGQWGTAVEFSSGTLHYYRPTISNLANGHLAWAWDNGSSTYKAVYNGISWSVTEVYDASTRPNLAINGSNGLMSNTRFVSTATAGTPYRLGMSTAVTRPQNDAMESILPLQYSRRVVVAQRPLRRAGHLPPHAKLDNPSETDPDTSAYLAVELAPITLKLRDGSVVTVNFPSVADSLDETSVWAALTSAPVSITSAIDSVFINGSAAAVKPLRLLGQQLGFAFDVVDADRGTVLRRIGAERLFSADSIVTFALRGPATGLVGRRVFLRPAMRGFDKRGQNLVSTVVHVYTVMDEEIKPEASLAKAGESQIGLPTVLQLHQNYPNPFNPTTELRFDLPEAGNVSLVVYDVLGREVATLASGYREAGYHSATWNASAQASGVYFARFNVTNADGKNTYSKINKLTLLR